MTAFIDLKEVIPKILKNINFEDYLLNNDFEKHFKKNVDNFNCYISRNSKNEIEEIVYLSNLFEVETYYSLSNGDTGSIIDFVKNRLEKSPGYKIFTPSKDSLIEACKVLYIYINFNGVNKTKNLKEIDNEKLRTIHKYSYSVFYNLKELYNTEYLEHYMITPETIKSPIFKGRIYNAKGFQLNNQIHNTVINTVFPLYDVKNNEVGLYYNNLFEIDKTKDNFSFFSDFTNKSGIWRTNNIDLDVNQRVQITLVSSPTEAFAHYQIFKLDTILYVCLFDINETSLEHLNTLVNSQLTVLHLAKNITKNDLIDEIKIISYLLNKVYHITLLAIEKDVLKIKIRQQEKDNALYLPFLRKMTKYNKSHVLDTLNLLGKSANRYLENDLFKVNNSKDKKGGFFLIEIATNIKSLYHFLKILVDCFPINSNIVLEKPRDKSWLLQDTTETKKQMEELIEKELVFVHKTRKS